MGQNILINSGQEMSEEALLDLLIIKNGDKRVEKVLVSKNTGNRIKEVCSKRPFKERGADEYLYYITGVGNDEKHIRKNGITVKIIRSNPRIFLLITRGKSRLKDEVQCNIEDWELIKQFTREVMSSSVLKGIENYESTKEYQWGD